MSMSSVLDELTCSVCFELYKDPIRLPCFHVFCRSCISDVLMPVQMRLPRCPECQDPIADISIRNLRTDFKINSMVQAMRTGPNCTCHRRHEHAADAVCKNCKVCVCVEALQDHGGHNLCDVKSYIDEYKREMPTKMVTVKRNLENIQKGLACIEKAREESTNLKERSLTKFENDLEELAHVLETGLVKIEEAFKENSTNLRQMKLSLKEKVATLQKIIDAHEHVQADPAKSIEFMLKFVRENEDVFLEQYGVVKPVTCVKNIADVWKKYPDMKEKLKGLAFRICPFIFEKEESLKIPSLKLHIRSITEPGSSKKRPAHSTDKSSPKRNKITEPDESSP